jgi:hypothetical protein
MHQTDLALQTSERARARSLLDMLAETQADIRQGVDSALLERERLVRQQLSTKAQTIDRVDRSKGQRGSVGPDEQRR